MQILTLSGAPIRSPSNHWPCENNKPQMNAQSCASGGRTHTYPAGNTWIKAEELGYHSKVITAGRAVNDFMPLHVFELLVDALNECERAVKNSKIVVLGFSYKENVGDPRESPVVTLLEELRKKGAKVHIIDPYIEDIYLEKFGEAEKDVYKALEGADAMVLMTAHREFREMDLRRVKEHMRKPIVIDGRRILGRRSERAGVCV